MTEAVKQRRTQAERREEAEVRLIDAAIALIAAKGTALLTMADIGLNAGYSRGQAHKHFGSKEKVLEAVLQSLIERFNSRRRQARTPAPGLRSIQSLISGYLERDEQGWLYSKALLIMMAEATLVDSPHREQMSQYNRRNLAFMKKHLRIAKEQGEIATKAGDEELAVFFFGTFRGIILQMLVVEAINTKRLRETVSTLIYAMLEPVQRST